MTPLVNVLVSTFSPYPTLSLQLPGHLLAASTLADVLSPICDPNTQSLSLASGRGLSDVSTFDDLSGGAGDVFIRLAVKLPGGKGGFGSQLRAAGGRMNSKKNGQNNTDSCRDLNGRRLSTIKEAKNLASYLEGQQEREAAKTQAAKDRLAKLNEEIRRMDGEIASTSGNAGPSSAPGTDSESPSVSKPAPAPAAGNNRKRRLDDQKYVEESREMVDNVKNAVAAAMLKKRKMKTSPPTAEKPSTASTSETATSASQPLAVAGPAVSTSAATSVSTVTASA